jgi:hypothetical protein
MKILANYELKGHGATNKKLLVGCSLKRGKLQNIQLKDFVINHKLMNLENC